MKAPCLFLKNVGNRVDRFACFKLLGDGMIGQGIPRFVFVVLESSVEEYPESRGSRRQGRGLTHIENGRNRAKQRGGVRGKKTSGGW